MEKKAYAVLILRTNCSNLTFTVDVDLRWTTKAFPALSRIQRALDKFLAIGDHWLAEDEAKIEGIVMGDSKPRKKYISGLSILKLEPLYV
jgi:hypothetical protein